MSVLLLGTGTRPGPSAEMIARMREASRRRAELATDSSGFAKDGLASDGWWVGQTVAARAAARRWVRMALLARPHMPDAECDRFIASLDPPKVADLIRRAVNGEGPGGF